MKFNYPKCPKCKSQNVELIEIWEHAISWLPDDNYFEHGDFFFNDPKKVEGNCLDCGHRWRIRNVVQVQPEWFEVTK